MVKSDKVNMQRKKNNKITIPLEIVELESDSFHLLVPVMINGEQGDMIVDTGASVTVADRRLFPAGCEEETDVQLQSGGITGSISDVRTINVRQFCIGELKLQDKRIAVIDLDYVNDMYKKHVHRKVIGLLGSDFFIAHGAVIDYPDRKLLLEKPEETTE